MAGPGSLASANQHQIKIDKMCSIILLNLTLPLITQKRTVTISDAHELQKNAFLARVQLRGRERQRTICHLSLGIYRKKDWLLGNG